MRCPNTLILFVTLCTIAAAQTPQKAEVFTAAQIRDQFNGSHRQASGGTVLGEYGSHSIRLSERTASGGAEVHAHFDDVMYVTEGAATVITGGQVIDPHAGANGETSGSGIRDGQSHAVAVGDIIHIPAGTPHQTIVAPGTLYRAIVIKVKE